MSWVDDFAYLLRPVEAISTVSEEDSLKYQSYFRVHSSNGFPDMEGADIAIVGVQDGRRMSAPSMLRGADLIRKQLYELHHHGSDLVIADLGNIVEGNEPSDTDHALKMVAKSLIDQNITLIVIGGSQDLTFANFAAYEILETTVNLAVVDSMIDLGEFREELSPSNFLSKIVIHEPSYLFNLSALGYQTYLNDPATIELLNKLYFDAHRLGELNGDIRITEPLFRNSDIISFDITAVANSSAPGTFQPNGFNGERFCQMSRYAGLSDKTTSFGVYNYIPANDSNAQTAKLIAQAIWCFIDGFCHRFKEYPMMSKKNFIEYKVQMPDNGDEMSFYKSKRTDKWWMNVPYAGSKSKMRMSKSHVVPCSYGDYELALQGDVPDMWWKTYQKLG